MKKYLLAILLLGFVTTSCYEKLNIAPPEMITSDQIQDILANGTQTEKEALLEGIAGALPQQFQEEGHGGADNRYRSALHLWTSRCLSGNDMVLSDRQLAALSGNDEYNFINLRTTNSDKNWPYWKYYWKTIVTVNKTLTIITDDLVAEDYAAGGTKLGSYQAQALAVRAWSYLMLMQNYQDAYTNGGSSKPGMPIYTYYDPAQTPKERASSIETYDSIMSWANRAVRQLELDEVGFTDDPEDIDEGVANFILALAALNRGEWATVITAANKILAEYTDFIPQANYVARDLGDPTDPNYQPIYLADNLAFTKLSANKEAILGFTFGNQKDHAKTYNAVMNALGTGNGGSGSLAWKRMDNRLYNQIHANDYRRDNFLENGWPNYPYANSVRYNIPTYTTLKWANTAGVGERDNGSSLTTNSNADNTHMRMSEVLLMLAEAQYMSGQTGAAETTINKLLAARTRSGAAPLTFATYGGPSNLLDFIKLQYRIEMWGENGLEYYNNKRWGIPVDRATSGNHTSTASYSVANMTLQIPENEMNNNNLMVQNP